MVCYEDFCDALDNAIGHYATGKEGLVPPPRSSRLGDTFASDDGVLRKSRDRVGASLGRSFNSERKPQRDTYRDFDDDDDDLLPSLKRNDSIGPPSRYSNTMMSRSMSDSFGPSSMRTPQTPSRSFSKLETPRSPPGRVGAGIWGSETPLGKKGLPPRGTEGKWCCAVCYYTENSDSTSVCEVCTSPNHNANKVSVHPCTLFS